MMIEKKDFDEINNEIVDAIQKTFDNAKKFSLGNFILFLADGEYNKQYENVVNKIGPYVIDSRLDRYKDHSRFSFFGKFFEKSRYFDNFCG